jgi:hypothetical protein
VSKNQYARLACCAIIFNSLYEKIALKLTFKTNHTFDLQEISAFHNIRLSEIKRHKNG